VTGVRCLLMRGGTSKGAYFLADDLPTEPGRREDLLLSVMGSPDPRQIDGIGGAHPLTSKVAIVSRSTAPGVDVDYLFLQVGVDEATVSDEQNCGNLLAGVGPFAVERGLVPAGDERTTVRIRMVNSDSLAVAHVATPGGVVDYSGDTAISGVPGTAAPIVLDLADTAGSAGRGLLPTGHVMDVVDGVRVTCVDNGMVVVVAEAHDLGITGRESVESLGSDAALRDRVQSLRRGAAELMGLGDVMGTLVPKTTLVAPPVDGGTISTRSFIPVRPHESIGVLGAVSVATAVLLDGAVGHDLAHVVPGQSRLDIEHPTGHLHVEVEMESDLLSVRRSGVVRTARKLFDGEVFPR
jgi:4-oxalomesaconate tautomerase